MAKTITINYTGSEPALDNRLINALDKAGMTFLAKTYNKGSNQTVLTLKDGKVQHGSAVRSG